MKGRAERFKKVEALGGSRPDYSWSGKSGLSISSNKECSDVASRMDWKWYDGTDLTGRQSTDRPWSWTWTCLELGAISHPPAPTSAPCPLLLLPSHSTATARSADFELIISTNTSTRSIAHPKASRLSMIRISGDAHISHPQIARFRLLHPLHAWTLWWRGCGWELPHMSRHGHQTCRPPWPPKPSLFVSAAQTGAPVLPVVFKLSDYSPLPSSMST